MTSHFHLIVVEPPDEVIADKRTRVGALCSTQEAFAHEMEIERRGREGREVGWRACLLPCLGGAR